MEIDGADKLLDTFGFFPVFHDAEILSITLDRNTVSASFTLLVPKFVDGTLTSTIEVVFLFDDIEEFRLENFNHQNVVSTLTFEPVTQALDNSSDQPPRIRVDLDSLFGAWSQFTCSQVHVASANESTQRLGDPPYLHR